MLVECPRCSDQFTWSDADAGRWARCPNPWCRDVFRLPHAGAANRPTAESPRPVSRFLRLGLAAPFDVASTAVPAYPDAPAGFVPSRIRFVSGCFDRSLKVVGDGGACIRLLVDHDPRRVLATTAAGDFSVWADDAALYVGLHTRRASEAVAAHPHLTELSAGHISLSDRVVWDARGRLRDVVSAELTEISLVARGAFAGTGWSATAAVASDPFAAMVEQMSKTAAAAYRAAHRC